MLYAGLSDVVVLVVFLVSRHRHSLACYGCDAVVQVVAAIMTSPSVAAVFHPEVFPVDMAKSRGIAIGGAGKGPAIALLDSQFEGLPKEAFLLLPHRRSP